MVNSQKTIRVLNVILLSSGSCRYDSDGIHHLQYASSREPVKEYWRSVTAYSIEYITPELRNSGPWDEIRFVNVSNAQDTIGYDICCWLEQNPLFSPDAVRVLGASATFSTKNMFTVLGRMYPRCNLSMGHFWR